MLRKWNKFWHYDLPTIRLLIRTHNPEDATRPFEAYPVYSNRVSSKTVLI